MSFLELFEFRNTQKSTDEDPLQKWNETKEQYEQALFRMKQDVLEKKVTCMFCQIFRIKFRNKISSGPI
jgi:hypothetical protein